MDEFSEPLDLTSAPFREEERRFAPPTVRRTSESPAEGEPQVVVSHEGVKVGIKGSVSWNVPPPMLMAAGQALIEAACTPAHCAFVNHDGKASRTAPSPSTSEWMSVSSDAKPSFVTFSRFATGMGGGFRSIDMHPDLAIGLGLAAKDVAGKLLVQSLEQIVEANGGVLIYTPADAMRERIKPPATLATELGKLPPGPNPVLPMDGY